MWTCRHCRAPQEGLKCRVFSVAWDGEGLGSLELATEELDDGGEFACDDGDRAEDDRAEQVGIPRQGKRGAFHDREGSFDDDRVDGGDGRADDTEPDAFERKRRAVEEDAREEASGDDGAGGEDGDGWSCMEEGEGAQDGKGEDEPACDLVKGGIDVFEGVVG